MPVFGSALKANLDKQGDLTSVTGYAAPDLDLSTTPESSAAEAGEVALGIVTANPPTGSNDKAADTAGLRADGAELVVYRKGSVNARE